MLVLKVLVLILLGPEKLKGSGLEFGFWSTSPVRAFSFKVWA